MALISDWLLVYQLDSQFSSLQSSSSLQQSSCGGASNITNVSRLVALSLLPPRPVVEQLQHKKPLLLQILAVLQVLTKHNLRLLHRLNPCRILRTQRRVLRWLTPHPVLTPLRLLRIYTPHNQFRTLCIVLFIQYSKSQLRTTRHPLPSILPTLKKLPLFPTLHLLLMMQPSVAYAPQVMHT